jgi:hypothetical protein
MFMAGFVGFQGFRPGVTVRRTRIISPAIEYAGIS